jgi:histidinol-phosphate aminotransferase
MIKDERKRVFDQLSRIKDIKAFESNANFIFFESHNKYNAILKSLKKERLVVKAFGNVEGRIGCIRVTIGTKNMNDRFLESIERAVCKQNV